MRTSNKDIIRIERGTIHHKRKKGVNGLAPGHPPVGGVWWGGGGWGKLIAVKCEKLKRTLLELAGGR